MTSLPAIEYIIYMIPSTSLYRTTTPITLLLRISF